MASLATLPEYKNLVFLFCLIRVLLQLVESLGKRGTARPVPSSTFRGWFVSLQQSLETILLLSHLCLGLAATFESSGG